MLRIALGQLRQGVRELQQQLQAVLVAQGVEVLGDLLEALRHRRLVGRGRARGHRPGTSPGSVPTAMGSRTALPHSVHERSEEHTSELQSRGHLVCRLLLEKKKEHIRLTNTELKIK